MSLIDSFKQEDLVYGFREDLENYIFKLQTKFKDKKYFSQSHINKDVTKPDSDHTGHLTQSKTKSIVRNYGAIKSQTNHACQDDNRAKLFFAFLTLNYAKHNLHRSTKQCYLFKRLCKQGIQYAKQNQSKIHFLLDTTYDNQGRQKAIVSKGTICQECGVSAITACELRSIYRDWSSLKDTVIFWHHDQQVKAPWEDEKYSHLWKMYNPKKSLGFFSKETKDTIASNLNSDIIETKYEANDINENDLSELASNNLEDTIIFNSDQAKEAVNKNIEQENLVSDTSDKQSNSELQNQSFAQYFKEMPLKNSNSLTDIEDFIPQSNDDDFENFLEDNEAGTIKISMSFK